MKLYYVFQNEAKTHTTFVCADDVTEEDRVAYDGSKKKVVTSITARTREIADALFDAWVEEHQYDEP